MKELIAAFHNQPLTPVKGRNYIITPLVDHEPETPYTLMNEAITYLSKLADFSGANKVVGEEDRGGFIAALVAHANRKSLGMVKWNPMGLTSQIAVDFRNAYAEGKMYLHGVRTGDKVVIIEDLVDSGGTIISMIELLREHGVQVMDIAVVAEKEEFNGVKRIKQETGMDVKHLIKFNCQGKRSRVTWAMDF